MGCGCKGGSSKEETVKKYEKVELNIIGKVLRIPAGILLTLIYIVLSPFIVIYIWWLAMRYVFGYEAVLFAFLSKFKKNHKIEEDDFDKDFNEEDYELVDVEVIK
jgi:hypothetical protein|tara:strand:+ start:3138 stop:3452 length:315 start_codon:yes stop_codon:yes gene_type:complete